MVRGRVVCGTRGHTSTRAWCAHEKIHKYPRTSVSIVMYPRPTRALGPHATRRTHAPIRPDTGTHGHAPPTYAGDQNGVEHPRRRRDVPVPLRADERRVDQHLRRKRLFCGPTARRELLQSEGVQRLRVLVQGTARPVQRRMQGRQKRSTNVLPPTWRSCPATYSDMAAVHSSLACSGTSYLWG